MKKISIGLFALVLSMLVLSACAGAGNINSAATSAVGAAGTLGPAASTSVVGPVQTEMPTIVSGATSGAAVVGTAVATGTAVAGTVVAGAETAVVGAGTTVVGTAQAVGTAIATPAAAVVNATNMATMMAYPVADKSQKEVGSVSDFILNLCSDQIVYLVVTPGGNLKVNGDLLVPYDAVKIQTVKNTDTFVINMDEAQLATAPAMNAAALDFKNPSGWESKVTSFWSQSGAGKLTLACTGNAQAGGTAVAGTPSAGMPAANEVSQAASGRLVARADLQDQSGTQLGKVNGVYVNADNGALLYFLVQPVVTVNNKQAAIAVPFGAVSVKNEGTGADQRAVLMLKVDKNAFLNGPASSLIGDANPANWFPEFSQFWKQYVPALPTP